MLFLTKEKRTPFCFEIEVAKSVIKGTIKKTDEPTITTRSQTAPRINRSAALRCLELACGCLPKFCHNLFDMTSSMDVIVNDLSYNHLQLLAKNI
jgi:hypothetical protein